MRRVRLGLWLQLRDGSSENFDYLEKEFRKHNRKLNVTPGKKTVLAEADSELFEVDELRAQVGRWESGLRIETLFNKVSRKIEMYVFLNDMRPCLNPTDIPQSRERSRSPAEIRVRRLSPKKAGPLPVVLQFNCGFPRRKKVARSKRERSRKKNRKLANGVTDSSSLGQKRKRLSVPETEVEQQAFARMLRLKRRKLSSRTKMVKVDKGKERERRAQQKVKEKEREAQQKELKKKQGEEKRVEQRRTERERKEWNSGWRKLNASETACVRKSIKECVRNHEKNRMMVSGVISDVLESVFEIVRTKKIPFQAGDDDDAPEKVSFQVGDDDNAAAPKNVLFQAGNERETDDEKEKGLATEKKDSVSGGNVIASVLRSLLDGAIEQLELSMSVVMPELTDDESEEGNDEDIWNDAENDNDEMADCALTDSEDEEGGEGKDGCVSIAYVGEQAENKAVCNDVIDLLRGVLLSEKTDSAVADDEVEEEERADDEYEEEERADEHDLEVIENVSVPRMREVDEVWLTDDFDGFDRFEVLECLTALNVKTDTSQNTNRLRIVVQQEQLSNLISQQTASTVVQVLKKNNLPFKDKKRRESTLKMHFLRHPDLQQRILDDITACGMMSPVSSEAESDGQFSGPPSASDLIHSPATPSTASPAMPRTASPATATPGTASPATPGQASNGADRLWTMSRTELISFLYEGRDAPSQTKKPTEYYRTRVGIIMVDRLMEKLNDIDALTKVLENLKVEHDAHIDRRVGNLRSHFTKKEAGKEEMMRKQTAVLRELQLAVARSRGGIFTFPSEYSPSDFTAPSLPTTSNAHLPQLSEMQPPPPKRKRVQAPGQGKKSDTAHTASTVGLRAQDDREVQTAQVRFKNPSTYCYINALLNLLFSNPEFMRVLFSADTEQQLLVKGNSDGVDILKELRRLSQIPVTGDSFFGEETPGECGDVSYLKHMLGNRWAANTQEDAQELFTELYNRLSCNNFEDLFLVNLQNVRQCLGPNCPPSFYEEKFTSLSFPLHGTMSMLDNLAHYCQNELIDYNCEEYSCTSTQSNRRREIGLSGSAMVIVLERYRFGAEGSVRNDTSIGVPLTMFLNQKQWHLTGALKNSSGSNSTSHGHFSGVRRDLVTGHFFCNNDSALLERMHTDDALHFINHSYMLMYCTEEALPGQRAPPIPVEGGPPGGDQPAFASQTDAHARARKVDKVNSAGDQAVSTGQGDGSVHRSTAADNESVPNARKKAAGKRKGTGMKHLADDFLPPKEVQTKIRKDAEARRVHLEARHANLQRDNFSWHDLPPNPLLQNILAYEAELNKFTTVECHHCKEVLLGEKLNKNKMCQKCHNDDKRRAPEEVRKWSAANNMHPDDEVPDALKDLTPVEQSAIQKMFVVMKIYRLARGATFLKGHCLAVNQDVAEFATRLPLLPADLPIVVLIGPNQQVPLKANANKILRALEWLKKHNEFYKDIEIDHEALKAYPSNDTDDVQGLTTIESETLDEEADPADAYTGEEGTDLVYTSIQGVVQQATVKEEIKRYVLSEDEADIPKVEWPHREKKPANENIRGAYSMMFPWLFPTGAGDITVRGAAEKPQFLAWLRHLLNHRSRRFAHDQRFIHYVGNRHQKEQALQLGSCFVNYSRTDITLEKLKEEVANNNLSTFASLLYFSRSIVGSRQFFRYEAKKSLSLINFIHIMSDMEETMNLFVTLSFADQHDPALHLLFDESHHYLNKTVVNSLADIPEGGRPGDYILASEDHRLRTEAVQKNGDIVCQYLDKKLWLFFEHVLKPLGVIDYILRVEFQYRSSEHFHMVLRLLDGVSVDNVHRAFTLSEFELKGVEEVSKLAPEEQERVGAEHEMALTSRRQVADFSAFRLGETAIHPQKDPKQWPGKEGLNIQKPRVNCLRRQFSDVVKQNTFPFQVPRGRKRKQPEPENILVDEATAQRIIDDAILMVNRTQLHKCTARYCLKIVVAAAMLCKFHFPKELEGFSAEQIGMLYDVVQNQMADHAGAVFEGNDLKHARNHPRLVVTISEFILGWRSNNNTRFVQSVHQLIEYLLKYIMKVTSGSKSFENTVKDITNQTDDNAKVSSVFQKLLMRNITEHDMSRTEAFRLVLGKPMVYYSREFRTVNLLGLRRVVNDDEGVGEAGANRKATKDNRADLYWRRDTDSNFADLVDRYNEGAISLPVRPCDINLYMYVACFESNWTPSRKTYVPLPSPLHKYPPDPREPKAAENRKDYLRAQLLLFQPGMRPSRLPDDLEGLEAEMRKFITTAHCPKLISEAFLKSWEKKDTDAVQPRSDPLLEDPELPNEADIEQDPFMAGLGATLTKADCNNVNLVEAEEEGAEGLMQEHVPVNYTGIATDMDADWSSDRLLLGLNSKQVEDAALWLESRKAVTEVPNQVWTDQFEPDALNANQREVYNLMERLVMGENVEPGNHLIDVSGEAGTGKSRLIKTILQQSELRSGRRSRIRVCAFTNSAAHQFIGGKTAHRLFRLDVERGPKGTRCRRQPPLEGKRLQDLQDDFEDTRAIIIDEKSMIGCFDLWRIDQRLRQARPSHADQMFGGLVLLLCGDLSQLPPVGDKPLYYNGEAALTPAQSQGRALYAQFKECYFLTESMRQQGPENERFRGELRRLANGTFTIDDWRRWEERSFDRLSEEEQVRFHTEGVKLCGRNVDKVTYNEDGIKRCNTPILVIKADENNDDARKTSDSEGELPRQVPVAKGAAVVLTDNLWPDMGLINGSKGTVTHIVFQEGMHPGNGMPHFIVVAFPDYLGPPFLPDHPGTVPIFPRTAEWKVGTTQCTRRSFPLIPAYALTIHKSQGMTIDQLVVIDVGPLEFSSGLTYTVCTRTRTLSNVAFHPMPTFNRIRAIFKDSFKSKQLEVTRRMGLAAEREAGASNSSTPTVEQAAGEVESAVSQPAPAVTVPADNPDVCSYPVNEWRNVQYVSMQDYSLLGFGEQLNDVLIQLGLDYFERTLLTTEQRARLYVFHSGRFSNFIFEVPEDQIARAPSHALARAMHARVARITSRSSIDLFTKDIVLWPIQHSNHWYLVVGLNLGKPNSALFTLNSIGNYGEGAILEHIKAYLAIEFETLPSRDGQLPAIRSLAFASPQQTGGIDCGLYLLNNAEVIFRRFDQFSALAGSADDLGQNWFPSFSPLELRQRLAEIIENLSAEQGFSFTSWPDLHLS